MSATKPPRPAGLPGHRPSAAGASRPRRVAGSRRATVRPAAAPPERPSTPETPTSAEASAPAVAATPSSAPASERDDANARPGRSRLTVVLLALVLALAAAVGLLGWSLLRMDARADARKTAQVAAAESIETILSYDHAGYDKGVVAAKTLMTEGFAEKYSQTVATVRPEVLRTSSVVKADVVASSVVSVEPDRVKTLLFVNQTTTGKQVQQPRVDLNRVVVTLVRDADGGWLVSDIDAL